MRTLDLVRLAVASTFRGKLRTTLTVLAIFIGAFTLTLTSAVGTGVSDYVTTQVSTLGSGNALTVTKAAGAASATGSGPERYDPDSGGASSTGTGAGPGQAGTSTASLVAKDITRIEAVDGIDTVTPVLGVSPRYISYADHGKWVVSVGADSPDSADLARGAQLSSGADAHELLLPTTYLDHLGFDSAAAAIGEQVVLGVQDYRGAIHEVRATVVGVQNTSLFAPGVAVNTALRQALSDTARIGTPSDVATSWSQATVTVPAGSTPAAITAVQHRLTDAGYTGRTTADRLGAILTVIRTVVGVLDAFAVVALLAAGFGIVNTLLMSVQERTREIGLMKAMGMGAPRIFSLFSVEAVVLGLLGSVIGAGAAIGAGTLASARLSATLLADLPGLHLLQFTPAAVGSIVLVVMAIGFLAGALPARRAARLDPITALRYE